MARLLITGHGSCLEERTNIAEDLELAVSYGENGDRACYARLYLLREGGKTKLASASLPIVDGQNKAVIGRLRAMLVAVCSDQLTQMPWGEGHL